MVVDGSGAAESVGGTQGYAGEAPRLLERYESIAFEDVHAPVLHLLPPPPARVLDIGAGTGRDAAWFAARGHRVVAVEPTAALRAGARRLHPSPAIEWVDDRLPDLHRVRARGESFELVSVSAVWMHLDAAQRRSAMPHVAASLAPGGVLNLSLRHGPVPPGRRMFAVSARETIALAAAHGLRVVLRARTRSVLGGKPDVSWDRLAFVAQRPT